MRLILSPILLALLICCGDSAIDEEAVTERYENGNLKSRVERVVEVLDGESTQWHENGQKKSEGSYRKGEKKGRWTYWDEDGKNREETRFRFRAPGYHGTQTVWGDDGQKLSEKNWKTQTVADGLRTRWWPNGQKSEEGKMESNRIVGKWTMWYENGQKEMEGEFRRGTDGVRGLFGTKMALSTLN